MDKSQLIESAYLVGDKILVETVIKTAASGLLINVGNNTLLEGTILKTGPGILNPSATPAEEWQKKDTNSYFSMQCKPGDKVYFSPKDAIPFIYENLQYYIIQQHNIVIGIKS